MMYTMPKNLLSICVNFALATQQFFYFLRDFSFPDKFDTWQKEFPQDTFNDYAIP